MHGSVERLQISADDFLRGLLAALAVSGRKVLNATQPEIHRAFYRVVSELKKPELRATLNVDLFDVDYDPLYGQSRWFDRALTRAQRNLLISFPNPTYEKMQVKYGEQAGNQILNDLGARVAFAKLADLFYQELNSERPTG